MIRSLLFCSLLSFVFTAAAGAAQVTPLLAGDILDITVLNNPDLSRTNVPIAPDGQLYYLMIPPIKAAGMPLASLTRTLQKQLSPLLQDPQIDITLRQRPRNQYIILGQVAHPGLYDIAPGLTLREALAQAGGILGEQSIDNREVDFNNAFILKANQEVITLNVSCILSRGDDNRTITLAPGDYIYIAALAGKKIFILGQIDQPQVIAYQNNLTLINALASLSKTTYNKTKPYLDRVAIIRDGAPQPTVLQINALDIIEGKARDVVLHPQDIIYIPEKQIDWAEMGDVAIKAYTSAFATKTAIYTFDAVKTLMGTSK